MARRKQKIVCFAGQMMSGKDESADYLAERLNSRMEARDDTDTFDPDSYEHFYSIPWYVYQFHRIAFGDAVKKTYIDAFDVDRKFIEEWKRNDDPPPGYQKNVRESLMFIGDGFRQINPTVWVEALFRELRKKTSNNAVISDGRYKSEVAAVAERGGINVAIWRPGFENDIDHPSESELKPEIDKLVEAGVTTGPIEGMDSLFDFFLVNDGTIEELKDKIDSVLVPFAEKDYE